MLTDAPNFSRNTTVRAIRGKCRKRIRGAAAGTAGSLNSAPNRPTAGTDNPVVPAWLPIALTKLRNDERYGGGATAAAVSKLSSNVALGDGQGVAAPPPEISRRRTLSKSLPRNVNGSNEFSIHA